MSSEASVVPAIPQVGDAVAAEAHGHERHRHRRRHKPRSFYDKWIRPNRRELKTALLFFLCVVLGYLFWTAIISR